MKYTPQFIAQVAASNFVQNIKQGKVVIDNSEYITWDSCFAKGLYNGALKRVGARSRAPLAFGGAVHVGIDTFLTNYGQEDFRPLMDKVLKAALADAAITELDNIGDPKRNTSTLQSILHAYCLEYSRVPSMRFNILSVDGRRAVEQSFVVPLGTIRIVTKTWGTIELEIHWAGKIDVLSEYDRAVCPVDHKTTSVMGEKFVDDKMRSSQMLGYDYAARYLAQRLFSGREVFGVRINALAQRASGFEFKVFDIPYPDWKIAEWQTETIEAIRLLVAQLDDFLQSGMVVPTREHCVTKYGKCAYFDICDAPFSMRDRIIFDDSYFFVSDWSPLNE